MVEVRLSIPCQRWDQCALDAIVIAKPQLQDSNGCIVTLQLGKRRRGIVDLGQASTVRGLLINGLCEPVVQ
jgi:hypothetical protein